MSINQVGGFSDISATLNETSAIHFTRGIRCQWAQETEERQWLIYNYVRQCFLQSHSVILALDMFLVNSLWEAQNCFMFFYSISENIKQDYNIMNSLMPLSQLPHTASLPLSMPQLLLLLPVLS